MLTKFGERVLEWLRREYLGRARREWPRIKPVTFLIHESSSKSGPASVGVPRRRVTPVSNQAQLDAAVRNALPMIDTGRTYASLIPKQPNNVFKVTARGVMVGSRSPILARHQQAHSVQFQFGAGEYDSLKKNVRQRVGGKTNPFFTKMYLMLKRMHGKTYSVPARPLPTKLPVHLINEFRREAAAVLVREWNVFLHRIRSGRRR